MFMKKKKGVKVFQTGSQLEMMLSTRVGMEGTRKRLPHASFKAALAHLADVHLVSVFARGGAVGGEDGGAVAVRVPVDHADGVVQSFGLQDDQHGPEDLLGVALHCGLRGHDGHA